MKLHTSGASPFGRKVKVVAIETGLFERIRIENQQTTPISPNPAVLADNPLGKIPCLVTDEGMALFDSRVICEYLDGLHAGPKLFPAEAGRRFEALTLQALGDGMLDAGVSTRYETFLRPETSRWADWVGAQKAKITHSLDHLERRVAKLGDRIDIGTLTVACALGYLDFRYADDRWRDGRPELAAWYERMTERPAMQQTVPG
jgi:glutathione S-transferase